jgi:hypothetical protein
MGGGGLCGLGRGVGGLGGPRASVDMLCCLCCCPVVGGAVCWWQAIGLPSQSVIVGEVGRCVGVRWRAGDGMGVLLMGPVAADVRVYSSVGHL